MKTALYVYFLLCFCSSDYLSLKRAKYYGNNVQFLGISGWRHLAVLAERVCAC